MDVCSSCGATLAAAAQWCGQCYAVSAPAHALGFATAPATRSVMTPAQTGRPAPVATLTAPVQKTRWRKTPTTFGPVGRILATTGFVVPFILFVILGIATGGFLIDGAALWGIFILPLGLRDVWKAGQIPTT
jgi:hypothetical protein